MTAVATEALREDTRPFEGILTRKSHFFIRRLDIPSPSEPITIPNGPVRSISYMVLDVYKRQTVYFDLHDQQSGRLRCSLRIRTIRTRRTGIQAHKSNRLHSVLYVSVLYVLVAFFYISFQLPLYPL